MTTTTRNPTSILAAVALALAMVLFCAARADAVGQVTFGGCVSQDGSGGLCAPVGNPSIDGPLETAISPEGGSLYAAAVNGNAVSVYRRAPRGQITYDGCVSNSGSFGKCADLPGSPLINVRAVTVSPDGQSLYAAGTDDIAVFNRAAGGQITYAGCVSDTGSGGNCADLPGDPLARPDDVKVSPDGKSVYVAGAISNAVTVLDRGADGGLTYAGCASDDGSGGKCADVPGDKLLRGAGSLGLSRDGKSLYVGAFNSDDVAVFDRAAGGQITYAGCVSDDGQGGLCGNVGAPLLSSPSSVSVAADDGTVYVTGQDKSTVTSFTRARGGQITFKDCVSNDGSGGVCEDAPNTPLKDPSDAAPSPDGQTLYVSAISSDAVGVIDTDSTGDLRWAGCLSDDGTGGACADLPGVSLRGPVSSTVSPDGNSVYTSGFVSSSIAQLFRKVAPETTIDSGPAEGSTTADRNPAFAFSSDAPGATFECSLDGGTFAACTSPKTFGPLPDGAHRVSVRAIEGGDTDQTPATRSFTVRGPATPKGTPGPASPANPADRTGPAVRIVRAPRRKVRSNRRRVTVRFAFRASEAGARFRCKVDRGRFRGCRASSRFRVRRGRHRLVVRAIDQAGNAGRAVRRSFRVVRRTRRR